MNCSLIFCILLILVVAVLASDDLNDFDKKSLSFDGIKNAFNNGNIDKEIQNKLNIVMDKVGKEMDTIKEKIKGAKNKSKNKINDAVNDTKKETNSTISQFINEVKDNTKKEINKALKEILKGVIESAQTNVLKAIKDANSKGSRKKKIDKSIKDGIKEQVD